MSMNTCNATTRQIAQAIYRDPLADQVQPGICRVCGRQLESAYHEIDLNAGEFGFRPVRIVRALCDGIPAERVDAAYRLAESMRVEAYRHRDEYIRAVQRRRAKEQEEQREEAREALGLPPASPMATSVEVDTGEF